MGLALTVVPLAVIAVVLVLRGGSLAKDVGDQSELLIKESLDGQVRAVVRLADAARSGLDEETRSIVGQVERKLQELGGLSVVEGERLEWTAVNQFDQTSKSVQLPRLRLGTSELAQVSQASVPVPAVDHVRVRKGATATLFQRMNEQGDMLRVATSVINAKGNRAIGTFIPARMANGDPNAVVAKVLAGETFTGRAFVVDQWYVASYRPLRNEAGAVIGMIYAGIPEQTALMEVRKGIIDTKLGESGYIYVLNAKGPDRGRYVVSFQGKRDGEMILEAKSSDGRLFIRDITERALTLGKGEIAESRYPWQNAG